MSLVKAHTRRTHCPVTRVYTIPVRQPARPIMIWACASRNFKEA